MSRPYVKHFTDFMRRFHSCWAGVFGMTRITRSDESDHPYDVLEMDAPRTLEEGGPTQGEHNPYPRLEQYGDVCIPPNGTHSVYWKLSDGGVTISMGTINEGRPSGGKRGDRALYTDDGTTIWLRGKMSPTPGQIEVNGKGCKILLDKDGNVSIEAGPGQDVAVNGGSLKVARDTDPVAASPDLAAWMLAVNVAITNLINLLPAIAPGIGPAKVGLINGGAERFKG